ncbi:MAG: TrkH family potassium uptake protein [Ruminococcaceae bacterium]|nr:TrkH family potassium uptake protein [Oscillospiraceae bacterium]
MNYRMIKYTLGWILLFEALFLLLPTVCALVLSEHVLAAFLWSVAACLAAGLLLVLKKPTSTTLYSREGFLIVSLSWILLSLFGAMPLYISGVTPSYVDALFEIVSGFTTTGASIFPSVEVLPRSILFWRSFTHWVGGMGVLVFILAFLPLSGGQNMHIMKAESPGPSVSKLVPRVRTTALILYALYFVLTLIEFIMLLCGGMTAFEAMLTSFSTAGTGGFGFLNSSIGSFSPYIQIVVTVFMVLFSLNFSSYYLALREKWKDAFNEEIRAFVLIVLFSGVIIALNVRSLFSNLGDAFRHSFFTVSSIISTTGFATADFDLWPSLSKGILVTLMFIGACAGSTGGGIKVSRIIILCKGALRELKLALHPKQIKKISVDARPVEHEVVRSVNSYMICYLLIFVLSFLLISIDGHDLVTCFTSVAATLNNVGPGLSMVGPTQNFSFFSAPSKLILIFDMLAGRLELFPMLLLFSPGTFKKT